MISTHLTNDLLYDATAHRLILRVAPRRLSALIIGTEHIERNVLFHSEVLADTSVKSLENTIYDNPLLLSDFSTTDVIFSTPELFLTPAGTEDLHKAMADAMLPDCDADRHLLASPFGNNAGEVCYAVNADIYNFMARTFACASFHHSLAIDARALAAFHTAENSGIYALCEGNGEMNITAFNADRSLRYLNRPQPQDAADCAYYILAAADSGESITVGATDTELQSAVCEMLRKVRPDTRILPFTLPPDLLQLRRMAPQATFDMIFMTQQ